MPPNSANLKRGSRQFVNKGVKIYFTYYNPSQQTKRNVVKIHQETGRKEPNIYVSELCGGSDCTPVPVVACNFTTANICCSPTPAVQRCSNAYDIQLNQSSVYNWYYASCYYTTWAGDHLFISGNTVECCGC
jgi:hypothetical protein